MSETFNGLPGQTTSTSLSIATTLDGDSAFMLAPKRDAAYNVGLNNGNVSLKTSAVSISDAALVNGSTYTISNIRLIPGSASGTNKASYDLTETLAGSSTPLPTVSISGPDYPSTGKSIPLTVPGLSITLTGTPAASDTVSITPNASLFSVLDNAINNIGAASNNNTAAQAVSQALHNIDIGMGRVSAARGQAGELMNRADRITDRQEKRSVQMESDRSQAEDLDMIKGLSDFQNQQSGFQAALQTYAQIQKLSLFNYIS